MEPEPVAPDPMAPDALTPDPMALRRRVLLTGVLSFLLFFTVAYVVASAGVGDVWLLVAMVPLYLLVVRPLMRPVRAASALRRRLAYQAFLDGREESRDD